MTRQDFISQYAGMPEQEKISFHATLALELTVLARGSYVAGSDAVSDPDTLRLHNEVVHGVLGQLVHLIHDDAERYPDEVMGEIIYDGLAEVNGMGSLERIMRQMAGTP